MKIKILSVLIVVFIIFSGCASNEIGNSGDVKQSTIYQNYTIRYDEADNETTVTATFRFAGSNGTTLVLSKPSTITLNGDTMRLLQGEMAGAYYLAAWSKPLENGKMCEFVFTDTEGKKYTNTTKFNALLVGAIPTEIQTGMPLEIPIVTAPLTYGESIRVSLKDTAQTETFITEKLTQPGKLLIPATVMAKLKGKVTIEMKRFFNIQLKEATAEGGNMVFEYTLKPREVTVVQ